jgi:hypothetical protein
LLELEFSDLFLAAQWGVFPFDVVHLQFMLHTIELLLKLELVQLLLRLVQLRRAWLCCETGATGFLVPQLVELPLRLSEFQGALEMLQLFALVEFVDLLLLGRVRPRLSERVGRRPPGGRGQKQSEQQKTYSNGPEQFYRRLSFAFRTSLITIARSRVQCHCACVDERTRRSSCNRGEVRCPRVLL